ncbi:hypothetical protein FOA52_011697 [Chlamydomonas sp. UWO 241]|nr:hypothetical protein FOA52_011697 [Chlamydomonas sp. UWO 241]
MEVAARLEGHASSVACVAACSKAAQLASGGEDGRLVVHDLETGAAVFNTQLGSSDSSGGGGGGEEDAVAAVVFSSSSGEEGALLLYAAFGRTAVCVDQRASCHIVATYEHCADDVGCVAVHAKGGFLALGDDTGCVQVVDLATGRPFKTIRAAHSNIVSSVAFRRHRPWELLTGGLDMTVARWDFSRAKLLVSWQMSGGSDGSDRGGGGESGSQLFNPPMVHQIAVADTATDDRSWSALAAAAVGDGTVLLFDAGADAPAGASDAGGGGKGKGKGKSRAGGSAGGRGGAVGGEEGGPAECPRALLPEELLPGCRVALGHAVRGHSAAASCVCFVPALGSSGGDGDGGDGGGASCSGLLLASGGDDRKVLLWSPHTALAWAWEVRARVAAAAARGGDGGGHGAIHVAGTAGGSGGTEGVRAMPRSPLLLETRHQRKVNSMCTSGGDGGGASRSSRLVHIADTGRTLTCYRVPV